MSAPQGGRRFPLHLGLLLVLGIAIPWKLTATPDPRQFLETNVQAIMDILSDPEMKAEEQAPERRSRIYGILEESFDYEEMSKRALGRAFRDLNATEREEFIGLFGDLLKRTYIEKLERYTNEKVIFGNTRKSGDDKVMVESTIVSQGIVYPLHYSMMPSAGAWKIYDVNIEGVGLIRNYRSQFQSALSRDSFEALLNTLRGKKAE